MRTYLFRVGSMLSWPGSAAATTELGREWGRVGPLYGEEGTIMPWEEERTGSAAVVREGTTARWRESGEKERVSEIVEGWGDEMGQGCSVITSGSGEAS